jgi:hypothetical protein
VSARDGITPGRPRALARRLAATPLARLVAGHPTERALERFAAGDAHVTPPPTSKERARIARHLVACAACRALVEWRRALTEAARALPALDRAHASPSTLLDGALARRAAGERMLVPPSPAGAAEEAIGRTRALRRAGAAAAATALAAALLARADRSATAGTRGGELTLTPASPRAGDTVLVRYQPNAALAGAPRLRLRATLHPDDDTRPWSRPAVTLAWLAPRRDGIYEARVALPPTAAYVRLAVEDSAAATVDAPGGRPWDVVLADGAGRPRISGMRSQGIAATRAEWERSRAIVLAATRLHPAHPSGWWMRARQDVELAGSARADSVAASLRPRVAVLDSVLDAAASRGARPESWAMLDLAEFAEFAGAPAVAVRWRARLLADAPRSVAAYSRRVGALFAAPTSAAPPAADAQRAALDSLERWWAADRDSLAIFVGQALGTALALQDTAAARRWAHRAVAADSAWALNVAQQLAAAPGLAADALALARAAAPSTRAPHAASDAARPLHLDAAAWERARARAAAATRAVEGEALLALGRPRESVDALRRAAAVGWNASAYRTLGDALLTLGDTAAALAPLAAASADPLVGPRLRAGLATRLGARVQGAAWTRALAAARAEMHARVASELSAVVPGGDPTLRDRAGRRTTLSAAGAGRVTVVAVVGSGCGPALADLPALEQFRRGLRDRPAAVVAVTREPPDGGADARLRARGLEQPLWYDDRGQLTAWLDARGTPTYLVLDVQGRVRWRGHRVREAAPIVDALLAS